MIINPLLLLLDPKPGALVPPGVFVDRSGEIIEWRPGKVTVITVFAFWCDTWKTQMPRVLKSLGSLRGLPVDALAVCIDGRWSDLKGFDPKLRLGLDQHHWAHGLGVDRVPTTMVVDEAGVIRWERSGIIRSEDLGEACRQALRPDPSGTVHLIFDGPFNFSIADEVRRTGGAVDWKGASPTELGAFPTIRSVAELPKHTLDPFDSMRPGVSEIVRRVIGFAGPGVNVVLHPDVQQTVDALPQILENLRKRNLLAVDCTPTSVSRSP